MIIIEYSFLYSLNYALNLQGLFTTCFKFVLLNIFLSSTTNPCNPLVTAFYFWFSQLFLILHIKWYIVFVFLCLNYLTFICSFHPCCCKQQDALLLRGWIILQCVCVCVCVCVTFSFLFTGGYLGIFKFLAIENNAVINMGVHVSPISCFHFLWLYTQKWNCWWIVWYIYLNFLRNLPYVFHSGQTYLHPHHSVQGSVSPCPHQHLPDLLDNVHNRWEVVSPCGFDFHYSGN